jgi:hypothetical protein
LAYGVVHPLVQVGAHGHIYAAHEFLNVCSLTIEVSLPAKRVPQLGMIVFLVPPHHIGGPALWIAEPQDQVGLEGAPSLGFVYVVEVVAKQDSMLFDVACSEVKELLRSAPEVW